MAILIGEVCTDTVSGSGKMADNYNANVLYICLLPKNQIIYQVNARYRTMKPYSVLVSIIALFSPQYSYAFQEPDDIQLDEEDACVSESMPRIVNQPSTVRAGVGEFAKFSVFTDACSATYQWRKNGIDIVDATHRSYTIDVVVTSDTGTYTVVVKNEHGSAVSEPVRLDLEKKKYPGKRGPVGVVAHLYSLSYPLGINGPATESKKANAYFTHNFLEFGALSENNLYGIGTGLMDMLTPVPSDYFFIDSTHEIIPAKTLVTSYLPINLYLGIFDYKHETQINTLVFLYSKFHWNYFLALNEGNQLLGTYSGKMSIDYGIGLESYFFGVKIGSQFFYNGLKPDTVADKYTSPVSIKEVKRSGAFNRFYLSFSVNIGAVLLDLPDNSFNRGIIVRPIMLPIEWGIARLANTIKSYRNFINAYPGSRLADQADKRIFEITWKKASQNNEANLLREFVYLADNNRRMSHAAYVKTRLDSAKKRINKIEWDSACKKNTLQAYESYFEKSWPGRYYDSCNAKIDSIILEEIAAGQRVKNRYLFKTADNCGKKGDRKGIKRIADAFLAKGDLKNAVLYYEKASAVEDIRKIADGFFEEGNFNKAFFYYEKISDSGGIRKIAGRFFDEKKYTAAGKYYEMISDLQGLSAVGEALFEQGRFEDAAGYFKKAGNSKAYQAAIDTIAKIKKLKKTINAEEARILQALQRNGTGERLVISKIIPILGQLPCSVLLRPRRSSETNMNITWNSDANDFVAGEDGYLAGIWVRVPTFFGEKGNFIAEAEEMHDRYVMTQPGFKPLLFGEGSIHRFEGTVKLNGFLFRNTGKRFNRLTFAILKQGYVYLRGSGEVSNAATGEVVAVFE
jgi:hypothetical protein